MIYKSINNNSNTINNILNFDYKKIKIISRNTFNLNKIIVSESILLT